MPERTSGATPAMAAAAEPETAMSAARPWRLSSAISSARLANGACLPAANSHIALETRATGWKSRSGTYGAVCSISVL
ncbi:Uncharacterised protein [Bordetella pertussis]|nr:Uncharacterised protein [Bordetella pertussis]